MQQVLPRGPPTDEERQLYYKGLPSRPNLVARSSTHDWVNTYSFDRIRGWYSYADPNLYVLRPVGSYPHLHRLWNNASSSLRVQILQALSRADWTAIDILRVCINGQNPITLMVAVSPGSLTWNEGYAIARECKSIFARYGIFLDCEIRESVVTFCTADQLETSSTADASADSSADSTNKTSSPKPFQLFSGPLPENDDWMYAHTWTNFSDVLGTTIAMKDRDSLTGTKGLYLSLSPSSPGAEPKILALTCRHVVIDSKTEGGLETYCRPESAPFKDVIQVGQPDYEDMVKSLERRISSYRKDSEHFNGWRPCSPYAKNALSLQDAITPFNAASSRVFGQLLHSPELNTTATEAQWLRDWALIELLPGSHQSPLSLIKNKVDIGSVVDFLTALFGRKRVVMDMKAEYGCQTMQSSVVPIDQIFKSDCTAEDESIMVIKYGLRGTFTLGLGNTLKSIVRHSEAPGGVKQESEAWGIVSVVPARVCLQEPFSIAGDSGACVWDMERRPAGMITAGSGSSEQVYDITYAQPLEGILDDMNSCGYDVSLV